MKRKIEVQPGDMTVQQARASMVVIGLFLLFGLVFGVVVLLDTPDSETGLRLLIGGFFLIWVVACGALILHFARLQKKGGGSSLLELHIDEQGGDAPAAGDFDSRLRKLTELRAEGLISDAEFEEKRARIMEEKW